MWWSEATQIRTIALWGIFGGDFIESDGFCAVFVVECNQNFTNIYKNTKGIIMEIVWLNTEVDAIHYVYDYAVPKQIPLDTFEKFVRSSKEGTLPEFYVISENGKYIGYILLLADKKEDIPKPFTFLACHNGDTLSKENHKKILEFINKQCHANGWNKLAWLAEQESHQL